MGKAPVLATIQIASTGALCMLIAPEQRQR